jgi:hypothetical protein
MTSSALTGVNIFTAEFRETGDFVKMLKESRHGSVTCSDCLFSFRKPKL